MFKVAVIGASGLLGRAVVDELSAQPAWQVVGTAFSRPMPNTVTLDGVSFSERLARSPVTMIVLGSSGASAAGGACAAAAAAESQSKATPMLAPRATVRH